MSGIMTVLYNPNTRCNATFPFHQRTGDMREIDEVFNNTIEGKTCNIMKCIGSVKRESMKFRSVSHHMCSTFLNAVHCISKETKKKRHDPLDTLIVTPKSPIISGRNI